MRRASFAVVVSAALVAACSSSSGTSYQMNTGPTGPGTNNPGGTPTHMNVLITEYSFGPSSVTIAAGGSVTWTNDGSLAHTVTADSGGFNSGQLAGSTPSSYGGTASGGTFSQTFTVKGTYTYHCANHPSMMGSVTVQ